MKTHKTDVSEVLRRYREAEEALRKVTAEDLLPLFAEAFRQNPTVKCFTWTQYTPYFNDGEPCTFGVHSEADGARSRMPPPDMLEDWEVATGKAPGGDPTPLDDPDRSFLCHYDWNDPLLGYTGSARDEARNLDNFVCSLPRELLERALGDGVQVFAWPGGLLTTSYSHD